RPDQIGRKESVDFSRSQHILERLIFRGLRNFQIAWRREVHVLVKLAHPFNRAMRHAVIVLQNAAHPEASSEQIALGADPAPYQIGRLADTLGCIDKDEAIPKAAMRKDRDRAEW